MKLLKIELENFQGVKKQSFEFPDGCSASIYGDNGTGKTTVYNALTWLLFDKASTGAKGFNPKTKGPDGEDLHHLNHGVTAAFQAESGRIVTLQKVFHEVYKKKRGSSREEFDGHTLDYFVDGVPSKEKEFASTVLILTGGNDEKTKMLTMPDYFPEQLSWQDRRKILLDVCGDVTDMDIIASRSELAELPMFLKIPGTDSRLYGIDEYRKIASAKKKQINDQLKSIPDRIDEAEKAIPDLDGISEDDIERNIAQINETIAQLQNQKVMAQSGSTATAEVQKMISDISAQIAEGRARHMENGARANSSLNVAISEAQSEASNHRRKKEDAEIDLARARKRLDSMKKKRDDLVAEWQKVNSERWDAASAVCPTCGRELPADKVEQMRSDFNLSKSNRLAEINQRGKKESSKEMIAECEAEIARLEGVCASEMEAQNAAMSRAIQLQQQIVGVPVYETTDEYKALAAKQSDLRVKMADESRCASEATAQIDSAISMEQAKLRAEQQKRSAFVLANAQKNRIAELEAQEKLLAREFEEVEKGLYLCEVFTKAKVEMLTTRINEKFRRVRFQLFVEQINGGVKEGCEVLIPASGGRLVPYSYANNAARINAGLEIIATLSAHWNIKMPVFVDNAESVTRLADAGTQMIRLVVSENDKKLRMVAEQ